MATVDGGGEPLCDYIKHPERVVVKVRFLALYLPDVIGKKRKQHSQRYEGGAVEP
jgi:hypothetical protein